MSLIQLLLHRNWGLFHQVDEEWDLAGWRRNFGYLNRCFDRCCPKDTIQDQLENSWYLPKPMLLTHFHLRFSLREGHFRTLLLGLKVEFARFLCKFYVPRSRNKLALLQGLQAEKLVSG